MWRTFCQFLERQNVDTDCIEIDLVVFGEENTSNLYEALGGSTVSMEAMQKYVRHHAMMGKSFATGFPLFYWKWHHNTKPEEIQKDPLFSALTDLGGHSVEDLRVYPHFKDLREEVIATGLIDPIQFNLLVVQKAADCSKSAYGRSLKSNFMGGGFGEDPLHFDIPKGAPLSPRHLQAMVLYCDFTKFCTLFSESQRKLEWDDTLEDVTARNGKFFHISKSLRELVTYFGSNGCEADDMGMNGQVKGPFFSGVSVVLNLSQFNIGFNAPTSTSKTAAIAWRFAGEEGMMLTVGNQDGVSAGQPVFDATWISCFVEEDEYFWFGSVFKLLLETISIVATSRSYRKSIAGLCLMDALLSGFPSKTLKVTEETVKTSMLLLEAALSDASSPKNGDLDQYVMDNLYCFCQRRTKIMIDLNGFQVAALSDFFFYKLSESDDVPEDTSNVIKPVMFQLFPNLVELQLKCNNGGSFPINLVLLSSVLEESQIPESFKKLSIRDQKQKWLIKHFDETPELTHQYAAMKWKIEKEQIVISIGDKQKTVDWVYIKPM